VTLSQDLKGQSSLTRFLARQLLGAQPLKPRLLQLAWLLVYAVGLGTCHALVIAPHFAYFGFEDVPPNLGTALVLTPTYLLCALRLPMSWERPSAVVYWMLFLVVVAPIHVLPVFTTTVSTPMWFMVLSVAAAFWLLGFIYSVRLREVPRPALPPRVYWTGFALVWFGLVALVVYYYGFSFRLVSLSEIYLIRDTYRESFDEVPRIARYAIPWLGNVVAPIAIGRGLVDKRMLWLVLGVATELFLVSITGFKQMMFSFVLVAGVVILVRWTALSRVGYKIAVLAGTGVAGVTAYDFFTGSWGYSSILIRRMVLTSAINTKYHYEFFFDNPKAELGYGLLSRFTDYPYELPPAFLIGQVYYGNHQTSANANVWADAFANFGLPGVFGFTAILAVVLYLFDAISRNVALGLGAAAIAQSAFSLANTAMLTVFMTHGLLLAIALVSFMPTRTASSSTSAAKRSTLRRRRQAVSPTGRRPRVLVLNQFAVPRSQGGGTRHVELFSRLRDWDHLIVAGNRNYTTRETFESDSPEFVTVPVPRHESNGLARAIGWCTYAVAAARVAMERGPFDVVYASSPHLVTPLAGWLAASVYKVPLVLEIRDLWPRSAVELGYVAEGSVLHQVLVVVERFCYRTASRIVTVSDGWEEHFASFGVPRDMVVTISNGAEPADFVPTISREEARANLGLTGTAAVYAGAHGPANGLDLVLDVARHLPDVTFVLVGDGLEKPRLVERARAERLTNVRFLDPVPKRDLANLFVACDVGLHTLAQAELFREALSPNKLYDYMAAGLPVITNTGGRLEDTLVEAGCAVRGSAEPGGDGRAALHAALRTICDMSAAEREAMGSRCRGYVERHASRTVMAERLEQVLNDVCGLTRSGAPVVPSAGAGARHG